MARILSRRGALEEWKGVLGLVLPADEVVHDIGMSQTLVDLVRPAKVPFLARVHV